MTAPMTAIKLMSMERTRDPSNGFAAYRCGFKVADSPDPSDRGKEFTQLVPASVGRTWDTLEGEMRRRLGPFHALIPPVPGELDMKDLPDTFLPLGHATADAAESSQFSSGAGQGGVTRERRVELLWASRLGRSVLARRE